MAVVLALVWASPAAAACEGRPSNGPPEFTSSGFAIHGAGEQAGALASILAEARTHHVDVLGMPAPPPDSCGTPDTDVYVRDLPDGLNGLTAADNQETNGGTSSHVQIDVASASDRTIVGHELFHVLQNAITAKDPAPLREATAEWAAARFTSARQPVGYDVAPGLPLDCTGTCSYLQWPFYEHLAESFGAPVVRAVHERAALAIATGSSAPHLDALDAVLAERSTSLAAQMSAYGGRTLLGTWAFGPLQGLQSRADSTIVLDGDAPPVGLTMNHLSLRALSFVGQPGEACRTAALTLRVAVPAVAAGAAPTWVRDGGVPRAIPVEPNGGAVLADEWNTCASVGRLVLAHGGREADGASFAVLATLSPPPAVPAPPAPAATTTARFKLTIPRRLRLRNGRLRFTVDVPRTGSLTARLNTKPRASKRFTVKAGRRVLSLRVPRRAKLARRGNTLTLTYADPLAAKPVTAKARVVLRRR